MGLDSRDVCSHFVHYHQWVQFASFYHILSFIYMQNTLQTIMNEYLTRSGAGKSLHIVSLVQKCDSCYIIQTVICCIYHSYITSYCLF